MQEKRLICLHHRKKYIYGISLSPNLFCRIIYVRSGKVMHASSFNILDPSTCGRRCFEVASLRSMCVLSGAGAAMGIGERGARGAVLLSLPRVMSRRMQEGQGGFLVGMAGIYFLSA